MTGKLPPHWSAGQRAEGERRRRAWEEFFSKQAASGRPQAAAAGQPEDRKITEVRARHEAELMRYPNVVGVAEGIKTKQGTPTGRACLVVYVTKKVRRTKLSKGEILPRRIEGVPVDVVEVGGVEALPE